MSKRKQPEPNAAADAVVSVSVTAKAPVNIAVIKYWGKKDTTLILPINDSLSGTIHMDSMCSTTTITAQSDLLEDTLVLNGKPDKFSNRMQRVLQLVRSRAEDLKEDDSEEGAVLVPASKLSQWKIRVESNNNFPTAAGLASSASGLACFAVCVGALFRFKERFTGELTTLARLGSGSACRSLHGGFVKWVAGEKKDGSDSLGVQVAAESHWPEMRVLILVAGKGQKKVSSTAGMQTSVRTSSLLKHRAQFVVPERMKAMQKAIQEKDFSTFGKITMEDSNQFHACALDTFPPIFYLNETSKRIIELVHLLNDRAGSVIAAYTFDAGPNAVIYCLDKHLQTIFDFFLYCLGPRSDKAAVAALVQDKLNLVKQQGEIEAFSVSGLSELVEGIEPLHSSSSSSSSSPPPSSPIKVEGIIVSRLGPGATVVDTTIRRH